MLLICLFFSFICGLDYSTATFPNIFLTNICVCKVPFLSGKQDRNMYVGLPDTPVMRQAKRQVKRR